ncbi:hypothetical protein JYU02_00065 [bacterium AH-315-P15]|nr:hypothetical protein [bacterium AH-315-P15]
MQDLFNNLHPAQCISPVVETANTAAVGTVTDRQGYDSLTYVIATGTLADADATFTTLVEHSDASGSGFAAVPDTELLGTEADASFTFAGDDKTFKIGYRGSKRFVRLTITPAGNAGNAPLAAIAMLGHPNVAPTANPPA